MGKNWKGGKNNKGGGHHDFASCRGHGVIIGTCDAARERETSKELVNLLNQAIEEVYPNLENEKDDEEDADVPGDNNVADDGPSSSIEKELKAELQEVKQRKHSSTQNAVSIKTDVKGITLIKLTRKRFCPIKLVNAIFERVKRENASCSRYVVRMIPLKHAFFPNEEELRVTMKTVVDEGLASMGIVVPNQDITDVEPSAKRPRVEEVDAADEPSESTQPIVVPKKFPYLVHFKARNHNVLTKELTLSVASEFLRPFAYGDVHTPEVSLSQSYFSLASIARS
jgi:hypothetical protein